MNLIIINSCTEKIYETIEGILSQLSARRIPTDLFYDVKLILSELFVNAFIHGNKQDPSKKITVQYSIGEKKLILTIGDEGSGFDYKNMRDPASDENVIKMSGRGLFLVKHLSDNINFNEKGNVITIEKNLD